MPPTMFTKAGSSESVSNSNRLTWLTKMAGFCRSGGGGVQGVSCRTLQKWAGEEVGISSALKHVSKPPQGLIA